MATVYRRVSGLEALLGLQPGVIYPVSVDAWGSGAEWCCCVVKDAVLQEGIFPPTHRDRYKMDRGIYGPHWTFLSREVTLVFEGGLAGMRRTPQLFWLVRVRCNPRLLCRGVSMRDFPWVNKNRFYRLFDLLKAGCNLFMTSVLFRLSEFYNEFQYYKVYYSKQWVIKILAFCPLNEI